MVEGGRWCKHTDDALLPLWRSLPLLPSRTHLAVLVPLHSYYRTRDLQRYITHQAALAIVHKGAACKQRRGGGKRASERGGGKSGLAVAHGARFLERLQHTIGAHGKQETAIQVPRKLDAAAVLRGRQREERPQPCMGEGGGREIAQEQSDESASKRIRKSKHELITWCGNMRQACWRACTHLRSPCVRARKAVRQEAQRERDVLTHSRTPLSATLLQTVLTPASHSTCASITSHTICLSLRIVH